MKQLEIILAFPEFNHDEDCYISKEPKINKEYMNFFKKNPLEEITEIKVSEILEYMGNRYIDNKDEEAVEKVARETFYTLLKNNYPLTIRIVNPDTYSSKKLGLEDKIPENYIEKYNHFDNDIEFNKIYLVVTNMITRY